MLLFEETPNQSVNPATRGIGGMTMNERLHRFGLFERFDACDAEEESQVVHNKLSRRRSFERERRRAVPVSSDVHPNKSREGR